MAKSKQQTNGLRGCGIPWYVVALLIFLLLLPIMFSIAKGAPTIIAFNNSISNDTFFPHVDTGQNIKFNVSANETITTWNWYLDRVALSNNFNNYSTSWSSGGVRRLDVNGTNSNGTTDTIAWYVLVYRAKSNSTQAKEYLNSSWYDSLADSLSGNIDFVGFFISLTLPFTFWLGNLFYVFVFGLPMIVIWLRQEKALVPAILGVIFGGLIFGFIPENWVLPAILMIILTVFGIVYALFKER